MGINLFSKSQHIKYLHVCAPIRSVNEPSLKSVKANHSYLCIDGFHKYNIKLFLFVINSLADDIFLRGELVRLTEIQNNEHTFLLKINRN